MVRRYTDGYRKTDKEHMESTNCTELEQVITRCLETTVKNEWAQMAKMKRRLKWFNFKGKRIVLLWWLLPFLTNKTKNLFAFALGFFQTFWLINRNCFIGSFYYIFKREGWKWKVIFIWLTKLNFKSLTDSRVGYKVIKFVY